jgi:hypothetical protein
MQSFARTESGLERSVLVYYTVTNTDTQQRTITDVRVGLFNDFDVADYAFNAVRWSADDSLMIVSGDDARFPLVAAAQLGNISSSFAIDNAYEDAVDSLNFGIYFSPGSNIDKGFLPQYKRWSLRAGVAKTEQSDTDISVVTASGPYELAPGASVRVGFVYTFAPTEAELRSQVAVARMQDFTALSVESGGGSGAGEIPVQTGLAANYPNPFNPATTIVADIARATDTEIAVYDLLGRRVGEVFRGPLQPGRHEFRFDAARLSSGVYLVVLRSESGISTRRITLLK